MGQPTDLLRIPPQDIVDILKKQGIRRFYLVYDDRTRRVKTSHELFDPIAKVLQSDDRDFRAHEGSFFEVTEEYAALLGAFVHKTNRGQGAGGVRFWQYSTFENYLRDGLRLSKGMTRKNALAGLWWGGGKGVISHDPAVDKKDPTVRSYLFQEFGKFITSIRGCYVTAEDVGTQVADMANIFSKTRFTTCIPAELGGSGNPSVPTARGVISGMEAALQFLNAGTLEGKVIAVQGTGNVGGPLIGFLLEKGVAKVHASDINPDQVQALRSTYGDGRLDVKVVSREDDAILQTTCDILAPCATGAVISPTSIPKIGAKIVCGAANNQLEDASRDDRMLQERGILYVPDFLTNRMGIVNCANEQYGYVNDDPFFEKHLSRDWEFSVFQTTLRVLTEARETGAPPAQVAIRQADKLAQQQHPIFGHRGKQIIDSLVADRWHAKQ